jgi:hypothetical protein
MAALVAALALIGVTFAGSVSGTITGNAVSYQVRLGDENAGQQFLVTVTNLESGQSVDRVHTANEDGGLAGTNSPGTVDDGDTIRVQVSTRVDGHWEAHPDWYVQFEKKSPSRLGSGIARFVDFVLGVLL